MTIVHYKKPKITDNLAAYKDIDPIDYFKYNRGILQNAMNSLAYFCTLSTNTAFQLNLSLESASIPNTKALLLTTIDQPFSDYYNDITQMLLRAKRSSDLTIDVRPVIRCIHLYLRSARDIKAATATRFDKILAGLGRQVWIYNQSRLGGLF